ncbi:MAG: xanthine dehydrogenase accessory protein XdhC [Pseudomonadota bacterium]
MSFDLAALKQAVAAHGTVGRIVIASHAGSVPRETGTAMLVWADGQSGTIGGGALEFEAVARLRARLGDGGTRIDRLPLGPALGQCCGGSVTLVSEVFDAHALPTASEAFIRNCGAPGTAPLQITRFAKQARNGEGKIDLVFENNWLAETIQTSKAPLWIYGAGHVGRALVRVIAPLPQFAITWVDTSFARFPAEAPDTVTILPTETPPAAMRLAPDEAHHLILTYSHALDLELCHQILSQRFASAGLIGSATKWTRFKTRLTALGHSTAQISRITCPIGDPAMGKDPQAIALGVASRLVLSTLEGATRGERATA